MLETCKEANKVQRRNDMAMPHLVKQTRGANKDDVDQLVGIKEVKNVAQQFGRHRLQRRQSRLLAHIDSTSTHICQPIEGGIEREASKRDNGGVLAARAQRVPAMPDRAII